MYRKDLDALVREVLSGHGSAEQIIYSHHLDYLEQVYFMKHLTSELIDCNPEQLQSGSPLSAL